MKYLRLHPWNLDYMKAVEIQGKLKERIILNVSIKNHKLIAGADVSYQPPGTHPNRHGQVTSLWRGKSRHRLVRNSGEPTGEGNNEGKMFYASVVVFELKTMEKVEEVTASGKTDFPYIPGLLSFRESPILMKAFAKIRSEPDVIMLDAQGIAHPRGIGLASHIGLLLDKPSIGCAKTRLIGEYDEVGEDAGRYSPLTFNSKAVGAVLRTRKNVKPVFVSPGNKIDLKTSIDLVLKSCRGYRLPEPLRQAHNLVKRTCTSQPPSTALDIDIKEKPDVIME